MSDDVEYLVPVPAFSPERPLQGMTVLVVEDSRFASEAIRLLCLRSGARIRRADSLAAAHRHLSVYRPTVVIADMGLPDGSGAGLIEELTRARPRVGAVIGMSGDAGGREAATRAGADAFLDKPIESLALFQETVLSLLPAEYAPALRALPDERIVPDRIALRDDLVQIAERLRAGPSGAALGYVAQFLGGVASSARDRPLAAAAARLARSSAAGLGPGADLARVAGMVDARIAETRGL